jgi:uncharacterized membrane protein
LTGASFREVLSNWRLVSWKTAIALVIVGVAFIFIGNPSGGNNSGNVSCS